MAFFQIVSTKKVRRTGLSVKTYHTSICFVPFFFFLKKRRYTSMLKRNCMDMGENETQMRTDRTGVNPLD